MLISVEFVEILILILQFWFIGIYKKYFKSYRQIVLKL